MIKCFTNYKTIHIIPNNLNEEDTDEVIGDIINNKDYEKSDTEIQTFDNIEEVKYPQEYENNIRIFLNDVSK